MFLDGSIQPDQKDVPQDQNNCNTPCAGEFHHLFSFTKLNSLANGQNCVGCHKQSCVKSLGLISEKSQQSVGYLQPLTKVIHVFVITLQSVNSNL